MTLRSPIVAIVLIFVLVAGGLAQQPAAAPLPEPRTVVAVLDLTASFHATAESVGKIKGVVRALGPNDTFLLLTLGGTFSPDKSVAIQCIMPKMDMGLMAPARSIRDWRERQSRITAIWAASAQRQAAVVTALDHLVTPARLNSTPLYQVLSYVSHWFASTPAAGARVLLIFSDLEQDSGGLRSSLPPKAKIPFPAVSVTAAFVPWDAATWSAREKAWRAWFLPAGFTMLDEANARVAVLLAPNGTPRQAVKAF